MVIFKGRAKWFINPPSVNKNTNPNAKSIKGVSWKDPAKQVANQLNIFIPVGTAIISVAAVKYALVSTSSPTEYIWWLQTTKPNTPMDIMAYTIPRQPNTLLFELAEIVVLITPKPGIINI